MVVPRHQIRHSSHEKKAVGKHQFFVELHWPASAQTPVEQPEKNLSPSFVRELGGLGEFLICSWESMENITVGNARTFS